jgi:uncharacterized membrane protein
VEHHLVDRRERSVNAYLIIKWAHIISSTVLFGTGAGIAFFFVRAQRTRDVRVIAAVSRDVVLADMLFTAVAVVTQPVTGFALMWLAGYSWSLRWLQLSALLYVLIGCCWLPVVWLQIRMRDLAIVAASNNAPLGPVYQRYYKLWFALGWPAFIGVLAVFYLMVAKPAL